MNYLLALSECHPDAQAYVTTGDPTVYADLIWITTPIPEATLLQCNLDTAPEVDTVVAEIPSTVSDGDVVVYNSTTNSFEVVSVTSLGGGNIIAYGSIPSMYGTTRIGYDNTVPQISEGTELFSTNVTPNAITSKFRIIVSLMVASQSKHSIFALFRDNVCIATNIAEPEGSDDPYTMSFNVVDDPNTTSQITYSLRVGTASSSGKWYVNRLKYSLMGGTLAKNGWTIEEFEL